MTEKRFKHSEFQQDDGQYQYYGIEDTEKNFVYNVIGDGLEMYDNSEKSLIKILNELHDENQFIKHAINEALSAERTELGKSVLKQLKQQIEVR